MSAVAIEVNDAGILAIAEPGAAIGGERPASPGYALLDGERVIVGLAAERRARLQPRFVHNRFWDQLDMTPLRRPFPRDRSSADLVHAHLSAIWKPLAASADAVLLAVPGRYADAQLGLMLGVARACGMPVNGMVDAAVSAAVDGHPGEKLLHLDVQLHRVVLTELSQGRELVRGRVEVGEGAGLVALHDTWAKRIAETFVRQTRFDPLHGAASEQALFRRLPDWLGRLRAQEAVVLTLESGGKEHSVELTREQIVTAVEALYAHAVQLVGALKRVGEPVTLLLSHRVAELPGLEARLGELRDVTITALREGAAGVGALKARASIQSPEEALPFVTRLPRERAAASPAPGADTRPAPVTAGSGRGSAPRPTHILHGATAYPITSEPFALGVAIPASQRGLNLNGSTAGISRLHCSVYRVADRVVVEDHSSYGSFLNDEHIEGRATLTAGDRLRLGSPGVGLQLIAVAEDHGTAAD